MAELKYTCSRCGRKMEHEESSINNATYCHPDKGEDCYQLEQSKAGTTAYQLIQMLHELPPSARVYVHVGEFDWEETSDLAIAPPNKDNHSGFRMLGDDHYWITGKSELWTPTN